MFIEFRERGRGDRGRERERQTDRQTSNMDVREKHQLVDFHTCPD